MAERNEQEEDELIKPADSHTQTTLQMIKEKVTEDDEKSPSGFTLAKIIVGDILTADMVRRQIWLILLIAIFTIAYIALGYQCQQDMITIDKLQNELKDAKYKALSSSSTLTERCRETHVLEVLQMNKDSLLHIANQPPYIIQVPEE